MLTRHAKESGADGVLIVTGYYNKPSQEGLYQHFKTVNDEVDIPIIVYNIPPRAVIDILPQTMARLATLDHVVGVKDGTCDLSRPLAERQLIDKPFCFLSGEDATSLAYNAHGGTGSISVTANIAPTLCAEMQTACQENDFARALDVQRKLMPLHTALFLDPSPGGAKYACALRGLCAPDCRLPILEPTPQTKKTIEDAMRGLDLI